MKALDQKDHKNNQFFFEDYIQKEHGLKTSHYFSTQNNTQKEDSFVIQPRQNTTIDLVLVMSIICCIILLIIRIQDFKVYKDFTNIITKIGSTRKKSFQVKYGNANYIILTVTSLLSLSFFIYISNRYFTLFSMSIYTVVMYIISFFIIKRVLLEITFFIYKIKKEAINDSNIYFHFWILIGIFLCFINVVLLTFDFSNINVADDLTKKIIILTCLVSIGSLYFYKTLEFVFSLFRSNPAAKFHIILYICTLEFLPILLLGKVFFRTN